MVLAALAMSACHKEFLDKKTDKSLLVPTTVPELQSLLDNTILMNKVPGMQLLAADELQPTDNGWQTYTTPEQRNTYIWAEDIYEGRTSSDWNIPFQQVLVSNIVLDGLEKLKTSVESENNSFTMLKGSALFYRAMAYYYLIEKFTRPYSSTVALMELGIPYHLEPDVNTRPGRCTLDRSYQLMINDFEESAKLLPPIGSTNHRPSKVAAYSILARIYLIQQRYDLALDNAEKSLAIKNQLVNFNLKTPYADVNGNEEVIFNAGMLSYNFLNSTLSYVNPKLMASYSTNDLRLNYYFVARPNNYFTLRPAIFSQNLNRFAGIATDEMYLVKAECMVRMGNVDLGIDVLNQLLLKRYRTGNFTPYGSLGKNEALKLVLAERKKELVARGLRWSDLRRLNLEPDLAETIYKTVKGQTYRLEPNALRYVFPIPAAEINLTGIEQNIR